MSKQDVIDYVMETPHNTNRAVLEGLVDTAVEESQVQADWSVNDENDPSYVKNRIGYYAEKEAAKNESTITAAHIYNGILISSSTPNSTKKFKITVDDTGAITATEVTEA